MTQLLKGEHIKLRALEPEDLDVLFAAENDSSYWGFSGTLAPFSRDLLRKYIANAQQDIFEARQLRLAIVNNGEGQVIGLIDLFDYHPLYRRAGVGILVLGEHQKSGVASEALRLCMQYAFKHLELHQLFANIPVGNEGSIRLFQKLGFERTGMQKDWIRNNGKFVDVGMYQCINPVEK